MRGQEQGPERVWPHQRTATGDERTKVMPNHCGHIRQIQCAQQSQCVLGEVEKPVGLEVCLEASVPAACTAISPLIRRDGVVPGFVLQERQDVIRAHSRPIVLHMHHRNVAVDRQVSNCPIRICRDLALFLAHVDKGFTGVP